MLLKDLLDVFTGLTIEDFAKVLEQTREGKEIQTKPVKMKLKDFKAVEQKDMTYVDVTQEEMMKDISLLSKITEGQDFKGMKYNFEKQRLEFYNL